MDKTGVSAKAHPRVLAVSVSLLITAVGLGVAHLVAALVAPSASPLYVVGGLIIDLTPTPLKEWAIAQFGDADKLVLVGSVVAGTVLLVALGGLRYARKQTGLRVFLTLFSFIPLLLLFVGKTVTLVDFVPAFALILTTQALLYFIWRAMRWDFDNLVSREPEAPSVSRRTVLTAGALMGAVAAGTTFAGQKIIAAKLAITNLVLPKVANPLPAKVGKFDDVEGISKLITPIDKFYRVDINLAIPVVDHNEYKLEIMRDGYDTVTYSYRDLLSMDLVERDITLACVSNSVGGPYVSSGRWTGVDLRELLKGFNGDDGKVDQLYSTSTDGYTCSTDLAAALDGRESMIAVGLNGEVLPRVHGFPARLLVPGVYGFVGATKWVTKLELTTYEAKSSYWTDKDWDTDAPIKPMTRIDTPKPFAGVNAGEVTVGGVAWAGVKGVSEVHVQVDGGSWQRAMIDVPRGGQKPSATGKTDQDYWVQWMLPLKLDKGSHTVQARCVTEDGTVQENARTTPFPNGASGVQSLVVTVT